MRYVGHNILLACAVLGPALAAQAPWPAGNEPLTLREAVDLALRQAPEHRAAQLNVDAAEVGARLQRAALLPTLFFSESAVRGNDPIYVFGTRMRQQRFTQADFALNQLNKPTPLGNLATRFSGDWTIFDSWKTEFAVLQAKQQTASAHRAAKRSDQEIEHRVALSYQGIRALAKQLDVARHQVETAEALLASSKSRVEAGVAVDSDELLAAANLAARQQELISAEADVAIAWAELERAVGSPIPEPQRTTSELAPARFEPETLDKSIETALRARPDRESLAQQTRAARAGVLEARSAFAPTLRAYGDWEADRRSFAAKGGNNWVAGAELRLELFPAAKRQELALARIGQERAQLAGQSADSQIRLEVTRAWYAQQAAARMVDVARASLTQTEESLRILRNRYNAGLATITDLLRGEDVQRQSAANYWTAVSRNAAAWCDLKYAEGTLNPDSAGDLQ